MESPVNLDIALEGIDEPWSPLTVAVVNDYDARVAKILGDFEWHSHPDTDELFVVLSGQLRIAMAERACVYSAARRCVRGASGEAAPAVLTRRRGDPDDRAERHRQHGRQPERPDQGATARRRQPVDVTAARSASYAAVRSVSS